MLKHSHYPKKVTPNYFFCNLGPIGLRFIWTPYLQTLCNCKSIFCPYWLADSRQLVQMDSAFFGVWLLSWKYIPKIHPQCSMCQGCITFHRQIIFLCMCGPYCIRGHFEVFPLAIKKKTIRNSLHDFCAIEIEVIFSIFLAFNFTFIFI
jgi:hypothetical protein